MVRRHLGAVHWRRLLHCSAKHSNRQPISGVCTPVHSAGKTPGGAGHAMIAVLPWMEAQQGQGEEEE